MSRKLGQFSFRLGESIFVSKAGSLLESAKVQITEKANYLPFCGNNFAQPQGYDCVWNGVKRIETANCRIFKKITGTRPAGLVSELREEMRQSVAQNGMRMLAHCCAT
jgi:hypothetical protein